jgi:hypothetical protein
LLGASCHGAPWQRVAVKPTAITAPFIDRRKDCMTFNLTWPAVEA